MLIFQIKKYVLLSSNLIYLSISNHTILGAIGLWNVLNQHFLPKKFQYFFLIDIPKSGVIIMVEYEIIVFTGTNYTFQLVLFSYSKPTPFNNLKFQNETSKSVFVCSLRSQFVTLNIILKSKFSTSSLLYNFQGFKLKPWNISFCGQNFWP